MLNIKMMQTGSSVVRRWQLREPGKGVVRGRLDGIVSKGIWRVLACPVSMLRIEIIRGWKSRRKLANPGLPGKRP